MEWTDRHCRFFHRLLTRRALLYTEMVTTGAVIHGDRVRLLGFDPAEQPVALQLGGSDPGALAQSARIAQDFGYSEINLNVGCPSDRVQEGRFGACLMAEPALVGDCVAAMRAAVALPITVKCRIGIDDQDPEEALEALTHNVKHAGAHALIVHARKAWLQGLSPRENRDIPPLDYDRVFRLKRQHPELEIILNGGIKTLEACHEHLQTFDGVMLGREAYHNPWLMSQWDALFFGVPHHELDRAAIEQQMVDYMERVGLKGEPWSRVVRHMLGLRNGLPGARRWRQVWSDHKLKTEPAREVARIARSESVAA